MPLVLAIEPEARQATILRRVVRERARAEITVVDSKDAAIAAIDAQIPDLILITALLSPPDEEELVAHLRTLDDAEHLQTITIPLLATAGLADDEEGGFFRKAFRRKKTATVANGCDPWAFAEQVAGYLRTAAEVRATLAAERAYARAHGIPDLTNDLAELRQDSHRHAETSAPATAETSVDETESLPAPKPSMHDPEYAFSWRSSSDKGQGKGQGQGQGQGKGQGKGKGKGKGRKGARAEEEKPAFVARTPSPEPVAAKAEPVIGVLVPEAGTATPVSERPAPKDAAPQLPLIKPEPEPEPVVREPEVIREIEPIVLPAAPIPAVERPLVSLPEAGMADAEEEETPRAPACEVVPFPAAPAPPPESVLMDEAEIEALLREALGDEPLTIPEARPLGDGIGDSTSVFDAARSDQPAFDSTLEEPGPVISLETGTEPPWTPEPVAFDTPSSSFEVSEPVLALEPIPSFEAFEPVETMMPLERREEEPVASDAVLAPLEPFSFEPLEEVESLEPSQPAASIEPTILRPLRRLPPLAAWARVESVAVEPPPPPAHADPENDLAALLGSLRVPPHVLSVTYPRRPRIRWVRTAA